MHRLLCVLLFVSFGTAFIAVLGAQDPKDDASEAEPPKISELSERASYSMGYSAGLNFQRRGGEVDLELYIVGMRDAVAGKDGLISEAERQQCVREYRTQMNQRRQEQAKADAERNLKEGDDFLAGNARNEGVTTLPSGLQYLVVKEGEGSQPQASDQVTVHYTGTLIDGTVFDSSVERGTPSTFGVSGVIRGWTEALQLMREGSKWRLFIPTQLAYGARPRPGGKIGPNAALIFDVELLEVKGKN